MRVAIVGSGPSGIACAKALNRRGIRPTILDAGEMLDPERRAIVERLRALPPERWSRGDVAKLTENPTARGRGVPLKLAFGSDYVYGRDRPHSPYDAEGVGLWPSFARGGYSAVWGAAIQPAHDDDLTAWPIRRKDLEAGYEAVLGFAPLATEPSRLDRQFALPGRAATIPCGVQGRHLLDRLDARSAALEAINVVHGRARLLVRAKDGPDGSGCVSCGLCLSGCPKAAIWSANDELARMIKSGDVDYRAPALVRRVTENASDVRAETADGSMVFDAIFLAAGALGTTRVLLESLDLYESEVRLKNSQKMLVPVISLWRGDGAMSEKVPTLAAAFLEAPLPGLGNNWMHVQVSGLNDLVLGRLGIDAADPGWRGQMLRPLVERLMVCWAGLHSDHSAEIALTLRRQASGPAILVARPVRHKDEARNFAQAGKLLRAALAKGGALAVLPAASIAEPGNGGHFGGSFPMSAEPRSRLASDPLGRPAGLKRIHVVDSTVFPSIPATPPTLTAMANAWRIACDAMLGA